MTVGVAVIPTSFLNQITKYVLSSSSANMYPSIFSEKSCALSFSHIPVHDIQHELMRI
jgi:hypothetical protein